MRVALFFFVLVHFAFSGFAETLRCAVCDKVIEGKYYRLDDKVNGSKVDVCSACGDLESRCFICGIPVKSDATKLDDGRHLCPRDAKEAIMDDGEAKAVCLATRDELDRLLGRYLSFPETNLTLLIVNKFTLESLFKSPGYEQRCTAIFGATQTFRPPGQPVLHSVNVLNGLSKSRSQAVAAHEFAHTWLNENLSASRRATLSSDATEAFCEWVAYHLMDARGEEAEKRVIKHNPYTRGQLEAFLGAESASGFNPVLEWVKAGESAKLDPNDSNNVWQLTAGKSASSSARRAPAYVAAPPKPLPDKLTLQNISGTPQRRFAIINERTFAVADSLLIKLAQTNLTVRCLDIRTNSVLVQIEGTNERQELPLPGAAANGPYANRR